MRSKKGQIEILLIIAIIAIVIYIIGKSQGWW